MSGRRFARRIFLFPKRTEWDGKDGGKSLPKGKEPELGVLPPSRGEARNDGVDIYFHGKESGIAKKISIPIMRPCICRWLAGALLWRARACVSV